MNKEYYIMYEVEGFPETQKAGPYCAEEIQYQLNDITGFEGVKNVRVESLRK